MELLRIGIDFAPLLIPVLNLVELFGRVVDFIVQSSER